jgi:ComF family protein
MRAAVAYGEVARQVALKLKYGGKPAVAETIARFVHRQMGPAEVDSILVPVPLHRWRIWKRGYNQAALIAAALARRTGQRIELDVLQRKRATPLLRGLGRRERDAAVRGAFRVPERCLTMIAGQNITVVDDVYTSGATVKACARALKRAGAARVNIVCWARVVAAEDR